MIPLPPGWEAAPAPRLRRTEAVLLAAVGTALLIGAASLALTRHASIAIDDLGPVLAWIALLAVVHVAFSLSRRHLDELLLPMVGLLGGFSLLLMLRLPQALVAPPGLAAVQLRWLLVAGAIVGVTALVVRGDGWLRRYKYTWAVAGIVLLGLVFVLGEETNGARLAIRIGPIAGQPSELLKVILVVFLAGYLADHRPLLARPLRAGPLRLPPVPYLLPMLVMLGLAVAVVIVQRDLGAAFLYYGTFLALLYVATRRVAWVAGGIAVAVAAATVLYRLFAHVRVRVDAWADPWADPLGSGYQALRALFAFGRGGILGTGLGAGLPSTPGAPAMPAVHTDLVFAALGEELGFAGVVTLCGIYLVIGLRGLRIAATADDDFRALLAVGLTLVVVLQAALIMAGVLKLVPLTGITLPFVSYGGSSLVVNAIVVGLLLAVGARAEGRR